MNTSLSFPDSTPLPGANHVEWQPGIGRPFGILEARGHPLYRKKQAYQ